MGNYAHIKEDGSVDYLGSLPKSWGNVSGLRLSDGDDEYLKTVGWLPLVEVEITPTATQCWDKDLITVEEDRVVLTHRGRDMTEQEIADRSVAHVANLREERNQRLKDSDWTQASDHSSPLADDKKSEWATYRQTLRDMPATVDLITWRAEWPTEPS
jgi:hypothetical protein